MEPLESCFSYRAKNNWWQMMVGGEKAFILHFPIHCLCMAKHWQYMSISHFSCHPSGVAHHQFVTPGAPLRALKRPKTPSR